MHDHALYLHVLSSSLRRQIVERRSFAEKVTFQLRFLLTSADIYHCLFGGPLALCLLISFHINSCFFDKITGFVSLFLSKESQTQLCAWQFKRWHTSAGQTAWSSFTLSIPDRVHSCLRLIFVPTFLVKMFSLYLTTWPISCLHDFMEKRI